MRGDQAAAAAPLGLKRVLIVDAFGVLLASQMTAALLMLVDGAQILAAVL